jgi:uncharacterized protein (TIGR02246 family)
MGANTPEEIHSLIAAAFHAGDLDAFLDLHEPDAASVVPPGGEVARGKAQIRAALEPIFAQAPKVEIEVVGKLEAEGLALTHARVALTGLEPGGPTALRGTIVSRRQPDGNWLIVLDNPMSPE